MRKKFHYTMYKHSAYTWYCR